MKEGLKGLVRKIKYIFSGVIIYQETYMQLANFCKQTPTQPDVWHVNSTGTPSLCHLTTLHPFHLAAMLIRIQACHFPKMWTK